MSARTRKRQRFAATCRRAREWRAALAGRAGVTCNARPTAHGVDAVIVIELGTRQATTKGVNWSYGASELIVPAQDADVSALVDHVVVELSQPREPWFIGLGRSVSET